MVLTHEKLLKGANLNGVISLMIEMAQIGYGNQEFWKKMEQLLASQLQMKRQVIQKENVIILGRVLAKQNISNRIIWENLL